MIEIYPKLTILEVGLLTADDRLGAPFHEFSRAHRDRLKPSWKYHLLFALAMLGIFSLFAMLGGGLAL